MSGRIYIGVDGGATKTQMAIADADGKLLTVHESGGTYYILEEALEQMSKLFAPISNKTVIAAAFTVAGWDYETDQLKQKAIIQQALAINNVTVEKAVYENDIFSTLKSAAGLTGAAVVISCGTGIIGLAAEDDRYYKTPGYEYLSGEWGSGIHQAEYAIHLACASLLGRIEDYPILIQKAFNYFEATDLGSLAHNISNRFTSNKQRGYFLKDVYDAYHEGCPGAAKVVDRAGEELARTAWCLIKRIQSKNVTLVFGGGVINKFGLPLTFTENLYNLSGKYYKHNFIKSPPVYGALKWALEIDGKEMLHL